VNIWFNVCKELELALRKAAQSTDAFDADFEPDVRVADPRFGDYQANGVLPFAKRNRTNPRQLAEKLLASLHASSEFDPELIGCEIAGPGFLNFTLKPAFYLRWLQSFRDDVSYREAASVVYGGKRVVIDYPSPNTAKQMHIGHLRPMVIGEAIQRILRFCGADVIRDNHIGDWGTNFGTLIRQIKTEGYDLDHPGENPLAELEGLYKRGTAAEQDNDAIREQARAELVKLQQGDPENTALWEKIVAVSNTAAAKMYALLGVHPDMTLGESFYRDKVDRVYDELQACGLCEESQGALVVFHREHPRFAEYPFLIRKRDGASNYASTDLATVLYRAEELKTREIVYVTDGRQQDHFQQLFLTVQKWFSAKGYEMPLLQHVWFGTILGEDGKAIKTRSGEPILLANLLEEAINRAYAIVSEKSPDLPEDERRAIAQTVGIAAVRYADLSQNRTGDYVFSWERLLAFDGNTAPYLLYAAARIHSIFRKAGLEPHRRRDEETATPPESEQELSLARKLVSFPTVLDQAIADLRPHFLCTYLFELAGEFSSFYNANRVIVDEPEVKARRLMLCSRTLQTLELGMRLLGIDPLERM